MRDQPRSSWDRWADQYADLGRAGFWPGRRRALVADLPPACRVLEVCCGGGQLVADLLRAGHEAYGEDLSPAMVARARVCRGDVTAIDRPDGSFDAVVCSGAVGLFDRTPRRAMSQVTS